MGRILFWLLVALAAYVGYRWWRIKQRATIARGAGPAKIESMVRCDVCGLNLPQSEAIGAADRWYCSEEHRRRGARAKDEA